MTNRIAASLALPDTESCLRALDELSPSIGLAEVRLDLMDSFDLARLISAAPCPLIITCRPPREGGRFAGSEPQRIDLLARAMELGCAYVDVEWDSAAALRSRCGSTTRMIVSRHWYDHMPSQLLPEYDKLKRHAAVVKLVGTARRPIDMLPVFNLLRDASGPVIAIAMGEAGRLTRVLAPCFPACLLTYGAYNSTASTAAGQLTVDEMVRLYHLEAAGPNTIVHLHLCAEGSSASAAAEVGGTSDGESLHLSLVVSPKEAPDFVVALQACLPRLRLTADPSLSGALIERRA